jgi:excisionase family DNA binding protein
MSTVETSSLLSVAEAASIMRVSRATAYRLIDAGDLPAVKVGSQLRVDRAELDQYVYGEPALLESAKVADLIDEDEDWVLRAAGAPGEPGRLPAIVSASGRVRVRREELWRWQHVAAAGWDPWGTESWSAWLSKRAARAGPSS